MTILEVIPMKKNKKKITSYWQKSYGEYSMKEGKWRDIVKTPITTKELEVEYLILPSNLEQLTILGSPIKERTLLLNNYIVNPDGTLIISLGVFNKFPEVWVKWKDLEKLIEEFRNGS